MEYPEIAALLNQLPFDIRAEVVAADLLAQGFDGDRLLFQPRSLFNRRFGKDILKAKTIESQSGDTDLQLQVSRDGLYDALPEGLFHQPKNKKFFRTTTEMVVDVKRQRKEEEEARQFFQPLENELYHLRMAVEQQERRIFFDLEQSEQNEFLVRFWNLQNFTRYKTLPVLMKLMPLLHRLSVNLAYTKICYELLLRVPVTIQLQYQSNWSTAEKHGWFLGHDTLGFQTVAGKQVADELATYQISIGPVVSSQLKDFLPGGIMLPYLNLLNSYFLPFGFEKHIQVLPFEKECKLELVGEASHLGVNTLLT